ncbi:MAG TPA: NUDIX domain-containing protein [Allosphingosinicella sp.]|jgi:8-oxo-dGTP pyrophosphatase MutT (NUDIX family)
MSLHSADPGDFFAASAPATTPLRQFGAYALIADDAGNLLTVEAANGRTYLPGGRIEPGETAREALVREIAEECGWAAAVLAPICRSVQTIMAGAVVLKASHWRARLAKPLGTAAEHRLVWLPPGGAMERLHRASDRHAVQMMRDAARVEAVKG